MLGLPANSFKQTDSGAVRFQLDCVIHFLFMRYLLRLRVVAGRLVANRECDKSDFSVIRSSKDLTAKI